MDNSIDAAIFQAVATTFKKQQRVEAVLQENKALVNPTAEDASALIKRINIVTLKSYSDKGKLTITAKPR